MVMQPDGRRRTRPGADEMGFAIRVHDTKLAVPNHTFQNMRGKHRAITPLPIYEP
jgi:hypothetical protein